MPQYSPNPQHRYSFAFTKYHDDGTETIGSSYLGINEQKVTKAVIDYARETAQMDAGAVLISVCYLGFFSEEEFHAPL